MTAAYKFDDISPQNQDRNVAVRPQQWVRYSDAEKVTLDITNLGTFLTEKFSPYIEVFF